MSLGLQSRELDRKSCPSPSEQTPLTVPCSCLMFCIYKALCRQFSPLIPAFSSHLGAGKARGRTFADRSSETPDKLQPHWVELKPGLNCHPLHTVTFLLPPSNPSLDGVLSFIFKGDLKSSLVSSNSGRNSKPRKITKKMQVMATIYLKKPEL